MKKVVDGRPGKLRNGALICRGRRRGMGICSNKNEKNEIYDFGFTRLRVTAAPCLLRRGRRFTKRENRGMRGEIAGDILPAVKSCRDGTVKLYGTVKLHPPRLGGCSGGERITTWRWYKEWYKENGNYACGGGRDLLAWVG